jgi:uncharacterized protein
MVRVAVLVLAFVASVQAQSSAMRSVVKALGTSTVTAPPDRVSMNVSVTTRAGKAKDAVSRNADQVKAVREALTQLLGSGAELKTVVYSAIRRGTDGYSAVSTLEVDSDMPARAGDIIDAAVAAGATSVDDVRFTLKDPDQVRRQALQAATGQARSHAESIARGLGRSLGAVLSVQEVGTDLSSAKPHAPDSFAGGRGRTYTATVLESGPIQVESTVVLEIQLN